MVKKKELVFLRPRYVLGWVVVLAGTLLGNYLDMGWITYTAWAIGAVFMLTVIIPFIFKEL